MTYTITLRDALEARGIELATFAVMVRFSWTPAVIDYRSDEPPHPAYGEILSVTQTYGPMLTAAALAEWADDWMHEQDDLDAALDLNGGWACPHRQKVELRNQAKQHADDVMRRAAA